MNQAERIGRFEVQERIRGNSFALVYRGRDPFDSRRVQIKVCIAADEAIRRQFLAAAESAGELRHPNIATVFEYGSGDSKPYLVQEVFSEETLSDVLARREPVDDVLKLFYLVQVGRALQHAHSHGVLHREVRPASVQVQSGGEAKLTDFGIARLSSAHVQLGNGAHRWPAVGWLLPELLLGLELDARSDIYGFGALAFELLTGESPLRAESLAELVPLVLERDPQPVSLGWPECPPDLDRLILRCLKRDPGQRYGTMNEVIDELDTIIPAAAPSDIVEEEKTIVTGEIQTIFVKESEDKDTREPETQPSRRLPDWWTVVGNVKEWGARGVTAAGTTLRAVSKGVGQIADLGPSRLRAAAIGAVAVLLFGVVGWSVVRSSAPEPILLPVRPPVRPVQTADEQTGLLIVNAQPWAEVERLLDSKGQELSLPTESYTPLPIELPPGRYEIELRYADLEETETCWVEVRPDETSQCEPRVAAVEVNDFFKETGWWQ